MVDPRGERVFLKGRLLRLEAVGEGFLDEILFMSCYDVLLWEYANAYESTCAV